VVAAIVVVIVVAGSGGGGGNNESTSARPVSTATSKAPARFYIVRAGDILSRVAERTDVSVGRILELNPNLDPNALRPGQRLRLRP
jgi:LysM repeat protein